MQGRDRGHDVGVTAARGVRGVFPERIEDRPWDELVDRCGGSYLQTSVWAQCKQVSGWRADRVVARDRDGRLVAGAQVLWKGPAVGRLAYVTRGPMVSAGGESALEGVLQGLDQVCRARRIRYLVLVPPYRTAQDAELRSAGYLAAPAIAHPHTEATTVMDLTRDADELLHRMRPNARRSVKSAGRSALVVRPGQARELPALHALLCSTAQRQHFHVPPLSYFEHFWQIMHPKGRMQLWFAEHEGEPVCGGLWISFGGVLTFWRGGWSGTQSRSQPNYGMHWAVALAAQASGHVAYDFEGVTASAARATLEGKSLCGSGDSVGRFKLGFGGEIMLSPPVVHRVQHRVLQPVVAPLLQAVGTAGVGARLRTLVQES